VRLTRLAGLTAAGALTLALAAPALAADAAKLTAVVAVDDGAPTAGNAWVRVLHGSPDAPTVDTFVNDGKVDALSGASFGQITDYAEVPAGTYSIKVCATADNSICPIGPVDLTFDADKKYTVAASDLLASIDANVFEAGFTPADGNVGVRVVHLSSDTPNVDDLTQDGATKVVSDLAYPDATGYLDLPAASYDLKVCATADNTVCPLDPGALDLVAGTSYSVFAVGSLAATIAVPATDTVPASSGIPAAVLALAGIIGLAAAIRFAPARARSK